MRISRTILLISVVVCAALAAQPQSNGEASGTFMVALSGSAAGAFQSSPGNFAPRRPDIEILLQRQPISDPTSLPAEGEGGPRLWVATSVQPGAFVAAKTTNAEAWDRAHAMIDDPAKAMEMVGLGSDGGAQFADPKNIYMIEPDVAVWDPGFYQRAMELGFITASATIDVFAPKFRIAPDGKPSPVWPSPSAFAWHLNYSGLKKARDAARSSFDATDPSRNVLVYHLDTGYYVKKDDVRPKFLDPIHSISFMEEDGWKPNEPDEAQPKGYDRSSGGLLPFPGHGTATLSVLAGQQIDLDDPPFHEELGGAPLAHVASCRISQSVVHLHTKVMTRAIRAAVANGADIITMAAGGPPSQALCDAVNDAYDNGTAMIFAASDFFEVPIVRIHVPPHTTTYPARFNRAIAVTGVTAEGRGYGTAPFWGWIHGAKSWALRGSYGPRMVLAHSIAAYTPNVAAQAATGEPNVLRADFPGTSAATPQVAAAAALWLQVHRRELQGQPPWEKAEAVYAALYGGAAQPHSEQNPHPYFGRGILDADKSLRKRVADLALTEPRTESRIGFDWLRFAGWLINATTSAEKAKALAHQRMLRVEVAQIVQGSTPLRKILAGWEAKQGGLGKPDEKTYARFVSELKRDSRASSFLKRAVSM